MLLSRHCKSNRIAKSSIGGPGKVPAEKGPLRPRRQRRFLNRLGSKFPTVFD